MKFRPDDVATEELLLGAGMIIGAFVIAIAAGKIRDWIEARKEGKRTPLDKMKSAYDAIKLPIDNKYEIPQSSDPQFANTKINGAHHAIPFGTFFSAASKLNDILKSFTGTKIDIPTQTKLLKEIQSKIPVYRDEKNGSLIIEFDDSGIVWPNDPFYKDLKGCNEKFESIMTQVKETCKRIIDNCTTIMNSVSNNTDEKTLKQQAAFISMCDVLLFLVHGTYLGYISNLETIEDETEIVE